MSVRKRVWKRASDGEQRAAYIVYYRDSSGKRRFKQFARRKDADAYNLRVAHELFTHTHVPDAQTVTVAEAAKSWLATGAANDRERSTMDQRHQHLDLHILPFLGGVKLNKINLPAVLAFQDMLRSKGRSPAMIKKITTSLGGIFQEAQKRGLCTVNPMQGVKTSSGGRHKKQLTVGVDIPLPSEMQALIAALSTVPKWRPILLTAIFTGMRASELRGLRWQDADLQSGFLHIRLRADRYNDIGSPKTKTSKRTIPIPPIVLNALREWKLVCPRGELDLVFPNARGEVEWHGIIVKSGLIPALKAAGLTDAKGRPKYTGLHTLRHWFASWCINRRNDGGRELPAKTVQQLLGHSSIVMTLDTYGHIFPSVDDSTELAAATAALIR